MGECWVLLILGQSGWMQASRRWGGGGEKHHRPELSVFALAHKRKEGVVRYKKRVRCISGAVLHGRKERGA